MKTPYRSESMPAMWFKLTAAVDLSRPFLLLLLPSLGDISHHLPLFLANQPANLSTFSS